MLNSTKELEIGQLVKSKAGRDKDKVFMVLSVVDEHYVMVVDGNLRKLENPKKKKVKHLKPLKFICENVLNCETEGKNLNDALIRKELKNSGLI